MPKLNDTDKEVIAKIFRNVIYGNETGDKNWESAREFYIKDVENFLARIQKKGYDLVVVNNKK